MLCPVRQKEGGDWGIASREDLAAFKDREADLRWRSWRTVAKLESGSVLRNWKFWRHEFERAAQEWGCVFGQVVQAQIALESPCEGSLPRLAEPDTEDGEDGGATPHSAMQCDYHDADPDGINLDTDCQWMGTAVSSTTS